MSQLFADDGREAGAFPGLKKTNAAELSRGAANSLRRVEQAFTQMNPRDIKIVVAMAASSGQRRRIDKVGSTG